MTFRHWPWPCKLCVHRCLPRHWNSRLSVALPRPRVWSWSSFYQLSDPVISSHVTCNYELYIVISFFGEFLVFGKTNFCSCLYSPLSKKIHKFISTFILRNSNLNTVELRSIIGKSELMTILVSPFNFEFVRLSGQRLRLTGHWRFLVITLHFFM